MKPERWQQIDQILEAAIERDRDEWAAFLDQECAGDDELRREVDSLLRAHEQAGSFIEKLPPEAAEALSSLSSVALFSALAAKTLPCESKQQ